MKNARMKISSSSLVSDNVDLLSEILNRLLVKTVIRFQCVSKHWLSVISDTEFRWNHTGFRQLDPKIYSLYYGGYANFVVRLSRGGPTRVPPVSFLDSVEWYFMEHSCNGLLLCLTKLHYVVCNPTTQSHVLVPKPKSGSRRWLAFDPSKSRYFNIITITRFGLHQCQLGVYSCETSSWKELQVNAEYGTFNAGPVFWDGALHWIAADGNSIFRFHVDAEKSSEIRFPEYPSFQRDKVRYFGECRGHFVFVVSGSGSRWPSLDRTGFTIFEMDKGYKIWSKITHIDALEGLLTTGVRDMSRHTIMTCVLEAAEENGYELVLIDNGRVVSFNTKLNSLKVLPHTPKVNFKGSYPVSCYRFVHPLVQCLLML